MALQANVPIIVASAFMDSLGRYHIIFSDPIPMQSYPDKDQEIKINGEKVLSIIEERIGDNPGQWLMYYPVWPDTKIPWD
jgi:lauroyl/myristoyl acyltransferase